MKVQKRVVLILGLLILSLLNVSKSYAQSTKPIEPTAQDIRILFGLIDKKDSLLIIGESIRKDLVDQIADKDKIIAAKNEQLKLRMENFDLSEVKYNIADASYTALKKENKRLKTQVRLFKGLSIGLPAAGLATLAYFTFR